MNEYSQERIFLDMAKMFIEQGETAEEIRRQLFLVDKNLLEEINQIPRQHIRSFVTQAFETFSLTSPILDIGCGYRSSKPEIAPFFVGKIFRYYGIDHTVTFRDAIEENAGPAILGDAAHLPILSDTISTVICTELLEHVEDDITVIKEISRILVPGGYLILTVPGKDIPNHEKLPFQRDYRRYSAAGLRDLLEGYVDVLTVVEEGYGGFMTNVMSISRT